MAPPAPRAPRRLPRRDALRLLAASTGAVAGSSLIVSRPALADSGSAACLFEFTGMIPPTATFTATNSIIGDFIEIEMTGVGGTCPCGGSPTTLYSFAIAAPNATLATDGWITSPTAGAGPENLWPPGGGPFTISAGVQVTCSGPSSPTTIRCRFASQQFTMPPGFLFRQVASSVALSAPNGNDTFANLPACPDVPASFRIRSLTSGGGLVPGAGQPPPDLEAQARAAYENRQVLTVEPPVDGSPIEPASPTTSPGTTTTTTSPPATTTPPAPTTSTTTSTTSTTTSTTTTTSTP